jgi:hypothetical protein
MKKQTDAVTGQEHQDGHKATTPPTEQWTGYHILQMLHWNARGDAPLHERISGLGEISFEPIPVAALRHAIECLHTPQCWSRSAL